MTLKEYQEFAAKGILPATLEREPIIGFALGLAGEAGEVVDDIKKKYFHGRQIDPQHTIEELGDVMWYVANLATQMNTTLDKIIEMNVDKLSKRYPDMYGNTTTQRYEDDNIACKYCGCTVYEQRVNGPHIQLVCSKCGKHIKFINKKEALKNGSTKLPWD